jgi:phytoene dehydrogenase-like protein
MSGATARLLFALSCQPVLKGSGELLRGPIQVAPDVAAIGKAYAEWRAQTIPEAPPLALRVVSATDPSLAPLGGATLTATVGCIPQRLFDGLWSYARRDHLRSIVTMQIERVLPGFADSVLACDVLVPPDFEEQIGATGGDLRGGELASDQMFGRRPGFADAAPRSFLRGLYLAGKSTPAGPLATGAAGAIAARAVLGDLGRP